MTSDDMKERSVFINISNHPSSLWDDEQREAASSFGNIMDIGFPQIDPMSCDRDVAQLADEYAERVLRMAATQQVTVHVMGEMTFTFRLVGLLLANGIRCVASTTMRISEMLPDGSKRSVFRFRQFRDYLI